MICCPSDFNKCHFKGHIIQYIILTDRKLRFNSFNVTSKRGVIPQYTPQGVYGLTVNETYEGIISFMTVYIIYCPYLDSTRDIQSNIPLCPKNTLASLRIYRGSGVHLLGNTGKYIPAARPIRRINSSNIALPERAILEV